MSFISCQHRPLLVMWFLVTAGLGCPVFAQSHSAFDQELSISALVSLPMVGLGAEYAVDRFSLVGSGNYCFGAASGSLVGYDLAARFYLIRGWLYVSGGYGTACLETGGHLGSALYRRYGAEFLVGGRAMIGEGPAFFFGLEAGAGIRTEPFLQQDLLDKSKRLFPKISFSMGMSFLRSYDF